MKKENLEEAAFLNSEVKSLDRNLLIFSNQFQPSMTRDLLEVAARCLADSDIKDVQEQMVVVWKSIIGLLKKRKETLLKRVEEL